MLLHDNSQTPLHNPRMDAFGERLRAARERAGMTQEQLGFELGVGKGTVSAWELGRSEPPLARLLVMRKIFGVSLDALLSGETASAHPEGSRIFGTDTAGNSFPLGQRNAARDRNEDALLARFRELSPAKRIAILELLKPGG
ncbi:MAG: helix-turn-helix transcriptional regulator [Rudaea sp.]|nr:helix-turn-helix transcriptional regulator [Eggerthellaceae bacterium]MBR0346051.1 helix-turn-helix transcriptional regulator [Rudaea sp.]